MLGNLLRRRPPTSPTPDPAGHQASGFVPVIGLEAAQDRRAVARLNALRFYSLRTINGLSGLAYGYLGSDPMVSLTGAVPGIAGVAGPTAAINAIRKAEQAPTPEFSSMAATDPQLDPYMAQLWRRLQAQQGK